MLRTAGVDAATFAQMTAGRSIAAGHGGEQCPVLIEEFAKAHSD
ncbi:hypothetical protein [Nocardia salmonicida]